MENLVGCSDSTAHDGNPTRGLVKKSSFFFLAICVKFLKTTVRLHIQLS